MQLSLFDDASPQPFVATLRNKSDQAKTTDAKAEYQFWAEAVAQMSDQYEEFHLWFLKRNLRILDDPQTGAEERSDILDWVNAPLSNNGRIKALSLHACLWLWDSRCDVKAAQAKIQGINDQVLQRRHALTA